MNSTTAGTLPTPISRPRWLAPFGAGSFLALAGAHAYGLLASSPDRDMGHLQKIMYAHVPAAWTAFVCFFVVFIGGALYLWKGQEKHDLIAAAAAETGAVMTALTLLLGSIWGRPTWGVWWTWDARLTSTAVLLVVFVGYLALRSFTEDPERRAKWSAAVGILGALNVPIVYMSVKWWRTLHQLPSTPKTVDPSYVIALRLSGLAMLAVCVFFIAQRYYVARAERDLERAAERDALDDILSTRLPEPSHV
ncbi:MAG TPA: cytochrome c biogenesis protein CcsA [Gemmatimonadaceae bacterium]|nr:cytochrome c biogenesis protein CcsA [Gemmatimonadaceae bacterium]